MTAAQDGVAVVYCEGAFGATQGKTAHGLVRRSERYRLAAIVDSEAAGSDAGEALDGRACGIPICASLDDALGEARRRGDPASHFVVGLAPDGGRLAAAGRAAILAALEAGLHVVSGLHDFLSEDAELVRRAAAAGVELTDVRRPPDRSKLHAFSGRIEQIEATRIAVLGTDSAVGKRTTAWLLVDALRASGRSAELVGTGQTAWLQGARYGIVLDALVNDFVAGEIEHAICACWDERRPDVIILEGQGSLMNPAYPGGLELLAAGRPSAIVLQHAPARRYYDGFPGYRVHSLRHQVRALQVVSGVPVCAVTLNHEGMTDREAGQAAMLIRSATQLPTVDPLTDGVDEIVAAIERAIIGFPL